MGVKSRGRIPTQPTQTWETDYHRNPAANWRGRRPRGRRSGVSALFPDVLARSDCLGPRLVGAPSKAVKTQRSRKESQLRSISFLFLHLLPGLAESRPDAGKKKKIPLMSEMRVSIRRAQFECRLLTRTVSFVCKAGIPLKAFGYLSRPVCPRLITPRGFCK